MSRAGWPLNAIAAVGASASILAAVVATNSVSPEDEGSSRLRLEVMLVQPTLCVGDVPDFRLNLTNTSDTTLTIDPSSIASGGALRRIPAQKDLERGEIAGFTEWTRGGTVSGKGRSSSIQLTPDASYEAHFHLSEAIAQALDTGEYELQVRMTDYSKKPAEDGDTFYGRVVSNRLRFRVVDCRPGSQ